ncbi:trypsin-like serine protease [Micromonospora sp. MS34]|uniref:trypsin-like serine protease n=1 Tax=Micromonospora sp. MS34 TaxID=3385971 RepID=UPI0039A049D1
MRIRRRVILAAAVVVGTVGAATAVAATRPTEVDTVPTASSVSGTQARTSAPAGAATTSADAPSTAAHGGRAGRGTPASGAGLRSVAATARPVAEVAQDAPASVSYLAGRYRVSRDEAARRVALQELSASLAASLAAGFPDTYAGMWLDQAHGGVLTIGATSTAPIATAVAGLPDAAHMKVVPVRYPLRRLTEAAARLAADLSVTAGTDVVVDEQANEVVVFTGDVLAADDARLAGALAAAGVPARARLRKDPSAILKSCDPRYCAQAPMRGGIRLDIPRDDGTVGGCTSGFNLRASNGAYYVLTAGHCVVGGRHQHVDQTWHQFLGPKVPVGVESTSPVLAENTTLPNDYAALPYQADARDLWAYPQRPTTDAPSLVNYWCVADNPACATSGSHDVNVTGVTPYGSVQTGWIACATGSAYTPKAGETYVDSGAGAGYVPGTRCGEIISTAGGGITVRVCARPGDSGGPLFTESDGKALGILHDGDPGSGPCTNPDEKNTYAPVSLIVDRLNARTGLGFQVTTRGPLREPIASSNR